MSLTLKRLKAEVLRLKPKYRKVRIRKELYVPVDGDAMIVGSSDVAKVAVLVDVVS